MNTVDHGQWVAYKPTTWPEGAPPHTMFARRESDGVDWYDYVSSGSNFNPAHVKIAASYREATSQYVTGPAVYDASAIFPAGCIVHEVTDYTGNDPQTDLGSKAFDPATGVFTDPVIPSSTEMKALLDRVAALEAKQGGA